MTLFGKREAALDDEIRVHLDLAIRERMGRGESREDAERNARREFGNVAHVREVTRDSWVGAGMERLVQDVRVAVRSLLRVPAFSAIAILTLALGIGANTAIFSVVNGVVLKPLPFPHPERLLYISSQFPTMNLDHFPVDLGEFLDLREQNHSFESLAGIVTGASNIGADGSPTRVASASVVGDFFHTLGVPPQLGRGFTDVDATPQAAPVAVLSWEVWQSVFGGQRSILNDKILIDGVRTTVVGIMPRDFDFRDQGIRIWLPVTYDPGQRNQSRGGHFLFLVGRLRPTVTPRQAQAELQSLLANWAPSIGQPAGVPIFKQKLHSPTPTDHRLRYDDLKADQVGSARGALWILQGAVALVLLIACANMANLMLVRSESRQKELALRVALGAGRWRLVRQFVAESVVLSLVGGMIGVVVAQWGLKALLAANGGSIPRAASVHLDGTVLAFTVVLAVGTGIAFGLAPLIQIRQGTTAAALRGSEGRATASASRNRTRNGLVVAEIALAVMLVIGAGLMIRSFWNLMRVDAGFDRGHLTTFNVVLPTTQYADSTRRVAFFNQLVDRLRALPGVQAAAAMTGLPPLRPILANDTKFEGYTPKPGGPQQNVDFWQWVTPNYLATMRIPVVAGRGFDPTDGPNSPPVVLINETLAHRFYPNENPIGRRLQPGGAPVYFTIVGIVKDVKQQGLDSRTGTELYIDYDQSPADIGFAPSNMFLVVRSTVATHQLAGAIQRTVASLDPTLPVASLRSMDDVFAAATSRPHFLVVLLEIFGALAVTLAAIGTYGVLSYSVSQRRRELGIRMALGAAKPGVLMMVLGRGMKLAALGLGIGLAGALIVTRLAASLLFGVSATDPLTFVAVAGVVSIVALAACIIPAMNATRVEVVVALRTE